MLGSQGITYMKIKIKRDFFLFDPFNAQVVKNNFHYCTKNEPLYSIINFYKIFYGKIVLDRL